MGLYRNIKDKIIYKRIKKYLEKSNDKNIDDKLEFVLKAISIKNIKERYEYLFDVICDYLDSNELCGIGICHFDNGVCIRRQEMKENKVLVDTYENGCCHSFKKSDCEYLIPGKGCSIRNIACKIFVCPYLRRKGYKYHVNKVYIARYFFNFMQKVYMEYEYFVPKEVVIKGLMKRRWFLF